MAFPDTGKGWEPGTDGEIVDRDAVAFEAMYRRHRDYVLAYCRRRAGWDDAVDVADEVFLVAWRRWDQIPAPPRDRAWLFGVARRILANQIRGDRRRGDLVVRLRTERRRPAPEPDPEATAEQQPVLDALARLGEADQEVLRLAAWEELSHAEIAEVVGASVPAVGQRLHRARERLTRELERVERRPLLRGRRGHG